MTMLTKMSEYQFEILHFATEIFCNNAKLTNNVKA